MPKRYRRTCDFCQTPYEGLGKRFCSQECDVASRRAPDPERPATEPSEYIHSDITDEGGAIYVEASQQIKTHEELLAKAEIDPDEWQITSHPIRTWSVPIKIADEIHVVQMYYVGVTLRPKIRDTLDIRPLEIIVKRPLPPAPHGRGDFVGVHYGDTHYPYQDDAALDVLMSICDDLKPDGIYNHGDLLDCEQLMTYPKDPHRTTDQADENEMAARHLGDMASLTHGELVLLEGNHEDRQRRVIWKAAEDRKLGALVRLDAIREALRWENLLGLDKMGWEFVPYPKSKVLRNKLVLIHGDKAPARGYVSRIYQEKYRKSGLSGHTHRLGSYHHTDFEGKVQAWHEIGCTCEIREDYTSAPNWQNGFMVVTWQGDRYGTEPVGIHDGRAFFRGKIYGSGLRAEEAA